MQSSGLDIEELKNHISLKDINFPIDESNDVLTLIFGNTGSGKSTLASILAGLQVMVRKSQRCRRAFLECEHSYKGGLSLTRSPTILFDSNNKIIYADCPLLYDCEGPKQEIINLFYIHYLLDLATKNNHKIKILLVVTSDEIELDHPRSVCSLFRRIEEIFPNKEQLERAVGIVITKGDPECEGIEYINDLYDNPTETILKWCRFFLDNPNKVFTLPKVSKKMVDTVFQYEDKNKLISFLKDNPIDNIQYENTFNLNGEVIHFVSK